MKNILTSLSALLMASVLWMACDKKLEDLPSYANGTAPVLSASSSTLASAPADSNKTLVTFNWTSPAYPGDSSKIKYVLEIDSTGRNFSKAVSRTITGGFNTSFTGKEMNEILLGFGFRFGVAGDLDVRVTSSYANNNDQKVSNVLRIKATPYLIPPKVALPASRRLFLVGDATQGGWNNPVPTPSQEFARIDSTTWAGVFNLNANGQFLVLPVNGDWSFKYSIANNTLPGVITGGDFNANLNDNFKGPGTAGWYKITLDFQTGKYTVAPYTGTAMPAAGNLFIVGNATPGDWNNPVPVPSQQFTRVNSSVWTLDMNVTAATAGKEFLILPVNGDWTNKYSVADKTVAGLNTGGWFGYNNNDNFPGPASAGTYRIMLNFALQNPTTPANTARFTVTKL